MSVDRTLYLKILAEKYQSVQAVCREIINLNAILNLPKGTEHFMSDLHGEYEAFCHILNNCSGVIREKVDLLFEEQLNDSERQAVCTLIYYPKEKLEQLKKENALSTERYRMILNQLIEIAKLLSSKYTRSKVRKAMPEDFAYIIDELLHVQKDEDDNQVRYHQKILDTILEIDNADEFIVALAELIKRLAVDHLHIVGDIFDRGPYADKIMDLFKSIAKVVILAYVVYSYLKNQWPLIYKMYSYTLPQAIAVIGDTVINVGIRISALFAVIAMFDLFYQKWKYHQDMMMSKQEVKDEYKNSEGDPKVKSQQKQRMQQASQRRMMQDLPNADVVITNPTHLAVAIKYDKDTNEAPVVVAKGADYLAQKIKERARENAIEIVENKPLARMLYHNVEIGAEIPPELYQMVAEVLAYVYSLTGRVN